MAAPPNATSANTNARGLLYSLKSLAPIGTMRNGESEPISAALATLLLRRADEEGGEVHPEEHPRDERLTHVPQRDPPARAAEVDVPDDADDRQPPERDQDPRRLSPLHEGELSENATTKPTTASAPHALGLSARRCSDRRGGVIGATASAVPPVSRGCHPTPARATRRRAEARAVRARPR